MRISVSTDGLSGSIQLSLCNWTNIRSWADPSKSFPCHFGHIYHRLYCQRVPPISLQLTLFMQDPLPNNHHFTNLCTSNRLQSSKTGVTNVWFHETQKAPVFLTENRRREGGRKEKGKRGEADKKTPCRTAHPHLDHLEPTILFHTPPNFTHLCYPQGPWGNFNMLVMT